MNKKISVGICISLIAIACTVTFVVTWTVSLNMYNERLPGTLARNEIASKLQEIDSFIRNNYLHEISEDDVSYGIFSGYIRGLDDRHTVYLTTEQHRQFLAEESGRLISAGIRAEPDEQGYLAITEVYPNSNAAENGIVRGDIITAIDGRSVLLGSAESALRLLDGEENTRIRLSVQRAGAVTEHYLVRRAIDILSINSGVVDGIGFMRITTFNALTARQFNTELQTFANSNVRALLIDVRNNNSGVHAQTAVSDMVNALVGSGTIARTEHRGGVVRDFIVTDNSLALPANMRNIPIVVLTNSGTSGAGELLAAILQNHAGAQIVGTSTAGNAYLQQTQPLRDDSAIRITVARIFLTNGVNYSGTGVSPNFTVEMDAEVSYNINEFRGRELAEISDPQVRRAFEIINTA
jgi:carboxyl-terminal processing protease